MDCLYNFGVSSSNIGLINCPYVCVPGSGKTVSCKMYYDPTVSDCLFYDKDPNCNNEYGDPKDRRKNASGKNISY